MYDVVYLLEERGVVLASTEDKVIVSFDNGTFGAYNRWGSLFEGDPIKLSFKPYTEPFDGVFQGREYVTKDHKDKFAEIAKIHQIQGILNEGDTDFVRKGLIPDKIHEYKKEIENLLAEADRKFNQIKEEIEIPVGSVIDKKYVVRIFEIKEGIIEMWLYEIEKGKSVSYSMEFQEFLDKFKNSKIEYFK